MIGARAIAGERPQVLGREPLVQGLEAEARGEELLERLRAEQELARAEPAGVDDHEVAPSAGARTALPAAAPAPRPGRCEAQAHPGVRGLGIGL